MKRWLLLVVIGAIVVSGLQGCVLVVADDNVAHDFHVEHDRSRLARDIQDDIDDDEVLEHSDIDVSERDGDVRLSGDVDSLAALRRAVDLVLSYPEVDDLELHLNVRL